MPIGPAPPDHDPEGFGYDRYSKGCPLYSRTGLPDWDSRSEPPPIVGSNEEDWPPRPPRKRR